jgi:hypothetical protein
MFATFKRYILDNDELLEKATEVYYNGDFTEEEEFYKYLSDDELKRVRKHIHIISLSEKIANSRGDLSTFYDAVLELLEFGEPIDNVVLIDLLKQIGKPESKKQKEDRSTKSTDTTDDDEVDILTKALYGWPTKL